MAMLPQPFLFTWKEIEASSDLDGLRLVLAVLPDEELVAALETRRGKGRNDYPIRPMWNALIAGIDCVLGFERHTIRGGKKMKMRMTLALVVMLAVALGRIRAGQREQLRCFTTTVARAA